MGKAMIKTVFVSNASQLEAVNHGDYTHVTYYKEVHENKGELRFYYCDNRNNLDNGVVCVPDQNMDYSVPAMPHEVGSKRLAVVFRVGFNMPKENKYCDVITAKKESITNGVAKHYDKTIFFTEKLNKRDSFVVTEKLNKRGSRQYSEVNGELEYKVNYITNCVYPTGLKLPVSDTRQVVDDENQYKILKPWDLKGKSVLAVVLTSRGENG